MRNRRRQRTETNYWMSYADLMSAMLMVFALLLTVVILDYREDLAEKQKIIEEVTSVKNEIIAALMEEFEDSSVKIEVDAQTGAIRFPSNVLFELNSTEIKPEGKVSLKEIVPKYFGILLQERFRDEISNIIIEGHTDREGTYIYNLNLSQQRAFSVIQEIYGEKFPGFKEKKLSQKYVTANGRSFSVPVNQKDGTYDANSSRRVEFLFRLKEDEKIKEIQELVNED